MEISLYQIYYKKFQKKFLDPALMSYSNLENKNPEWAEYWIFKENFENHFNSKNGLIGFLSWKFSMKTKLSGSDFIGFISENPGFDVYSVSPFPFYFYIFDSVWQQGEYYHPGLIEITQKIFDKLNIQVNLQSMTTDINTSVYCNYWAANTNFWREYMSFSLPIYYHIQNSLSPEEKAKIHSKADKNINSNYIAFIQERLFSTFLYLNKDRFKIKPFPYSDSYLKTLYPINRLNEIQKLKTLHESASLYPDNREIQSLFNRLRLLYLKNWEQESKFYKYKKIYDLYEWLTGQSKRFPGKS